MLLWQCLREKQRGEVSVEGTELHLVPRGLFCPCYFNIPITALPSSLTSSGYWLCVDESVFDLCIRTEQLILELF